MQQGRSLPVYWKRVSLTTGLAVWSVTRPDAIPVDLMRFAIVPPDTAPLGLAGNRHDLAISPDGTLVVYDGPGTGAGFELNLRRIDQLEGAPLRGTLGGRAPFVSPDGEWVGFQTSGTRLQKVSILGGPAVALTESPNNIFGASWGVDDQIVFGTNSAGLFRVSGGGGDPEVLTAPDAEQRETYHMWPFIIPDREAVVFVVGTDAPLTNGQLAVLDLATGDVTRLGLAGVSPHYVSTGHLVYAAEDQSVRAVPFDATSLEVTGNPVPLIEGVVVKPSGAADFSISDNGRLVYALDAGGGTQRSLVWVDREGREEPLGAGWQPDQYIYPRISPDGARVAVAVTDTTGDNTDLWVLDLARGSRTRITFGGNNRFFPVWTRDGAHVTFADGAGTPNRVLMAAADGSGQTDTLLDRNERQFPTSWAPDGRTLAFYVDHPETARDLWVLPLEGDQTPAPFLATPFQDLAPAFSPDGRWMAYVSDESGQREVYVRPYPGPGQQHTISISGGEEPVWSPEGRELYYRNGAEVMVVAVHTGESFRAEAPERLFEGAYDLADGFGGVPNYDIGPDGERFLMVKPAGQAGDAATPEITVVLNWYQELLERVPVD